MVEVVLILEKDLLKSSSEFISLGGDCGIELRISGLYEASNAMFIDRRYTTELSREFGLVCLKTTPFPLSISWLLEIAVDLWGEGDRVKLLSELCLVSFLREGRV